MVTDLQFYYAVRSYNYRINLLEGINELEQKIHDYMTERKLTKTGLPGYYIDVSDSKIMIKEQPFLNLNQLYLEFYADSQKNGDGSKLKKCTHPKLEKI